MVKFEYFAPGVLRVAPEAPIPTVQNALRESAAEFCEKTRCWLWRDTVDVDDDGTFDTAPLSGGTVFEVATLRYDGRPLLPDASIALDRDEPQWDSDATGSPRWYVQIGDTRFMLSPRAGGKVHAAVYLKPSDTCQALPDLLFYRHRQAITSGALARILLVPRKPFTAPDLAQYHQAIYMQAMDRVISKARRTAAGAPLRTKPSFV